MTEENEIADAFRSYEWIILNTNPMDEKIDLSCAMEQVPPYIRKDVDRYKQKEWLLDKNKTPHDILFLLSINLLLSELVEKGIPLYRVDNKEITCVADIKRLWKDAELDKNYYSFITDPAYTYKILYARLASQRLKTERELLAKLDIEKQAGQDTAKQAKFIHFPTPSGTQWPEVKISFIDNENVSIKIRDVSQRKNYAEMGFKDQRTCKPVKSWYTLLYFSEKECLKYSQDVKGKTEKTVENLRKRLKSYFCIQSEPIVLASGCGYKPVFKVCKSEGESRSVLAFSNSDTCDDNTEDD